MIISIALETTLFRTNLIFSSDIKHKTVIVFEFKE